VQSPAHFQPFQPSVAFSDPPSPQDVAALSELLESFRLAPAELLPKLAGAGVRAVEVRATVGCSGSRRIGAFWPAHKVHCVGGR
jgi:hypothetical protein